MARALQFGNRLLDLVTLLPQADQPVPELGGSDAELGQLAILEIVEIEHLLDLFQCKADPLAAQDQLETGAVSIAEQPRPAAPRRRQQPLLLVKPQGPGRGVAFPA